MNDHRSGSFMVPFKRKWYGAKLMNMEGKIIGYNIQFGVVDFHIWINK